MSEKKLTVAELLARASKEGQAPTTKSTRRRRRSVEEGGITVAELTGSLPAVAAKPEESKHSSQPIDDDSPAPRLTPAELAKQQGRDASASAASSSPAQGPSTPAPTKPASDVKPAPEANKPVVAAAPTTAKDAKAPEAAAASKPVANKTNPPASGDAQDESKKKITDALKAHAASSSAQQGILAQARTKAAAQTGTNKPETETAEAADKQVPTKPPAAPVNTAAVTDKPVPPTPPATAGKPAEKKASTDAAADRPSQGKSAVDKDTADQPNKPAASKPVAIQVVGEDEPIQMTTGEFAAITADDLAKARKAESDKTETPAATGTVQPPAEKAPSPAVPVAEKPADMPVDEPEVPAVDDEEDEDASVSVVGVVVMAILALGIGIALFTGFEMLWRVLNNHWVTFALACAVTLGLVGCVHALRSEKDKLSMFLAALAGLAVTFGPLAIVGL